MGRFTDFIVRLFRAPAPLPDIYRGARGSAVADIQRKLKEDDPGLKIDGIFGPKTEAAVRAAQKKHGLIEDGIVGKDTRKALK